MKLLFIFSISVSRYMILLIFLSNSASGICYVDQFSDSTSENNIIIIIIQNRWKISNVVFVYDLYKKGVLCLCINFLSISKWHIKQKIEKKKPKTVEWTWIRSGDTNEIMICKKNNSKQEIDLILYKWYQKSKNKNKNKTTKKRK